MNGNHIAPATQRSTFHMWRADVTDSVVAHHHFKMFTGC